jgi:hypothetical protein
MSSFLSITPTFTSSFCFSSKNFLRILATPAEFLPPTMTAVGRRQRFLELGQAQRLGSDAERAVLDDVELGLLGARRLRSSAASATVTFEKLVRMT